MNTNGVRIIEVLSFFNELLLLECRLNETFNVTDNYIIVELSRTHTNQLKPYFFNENKHLFERYLNKIFHISLTDKDLEIVEKSNSWSAETFQRDFAANFFDGLNDDDIIILTDADEIPRREVIENLKIDNNKVYALKMNYHQIYFNYRAFSAAEDELVSKVFTYGKYKQLNKDFGLKLSQIRYFPECEIIENGGWHFSSLGNFDNLKYKIESFAHTEHNIETNKNKEIIEQRIKEGKDIYGNNKDFRPIAIDNSYPQFVLENFEKLKNLGFFYIRYFKI